MSNEFLLIAYHQLTTTGISRTKYQAEYNKQQQKLNIYQQTTYGCTVIRVVTNQGRSQNLVSGGPHPFRGVPKSQGSPLMYFWLSRISGGGRAPLAPSGYAFVTNAKAIPMLDLGDKGYDGGMKWIQNLGVPERTR